MVLWVASHLFFCLSWHLYVGYGPQGSIYSRCWISSVYVFPDQLLLGTILDPSINTQKAEGNQSVPPVWGKGITTGAEKITGRTITWKMKREVEWKKTESRRPRLYCSVVSSAEPATCWLQPYSLLCCFCSPLIAGQIEGWQEYHRSVWSLGQGVDQTGALYSHLVERI